MPFLDLIHDLTASLLDHHHHHHDPTSFSVIDQKSNSMPGREYILQFDVNGAPNSEMINPTYIKLKGVDGRESQPVAINRIANYSSITPHDSTIHVPAGTQARVSIWADDVGKVKEVYFKNDSCTSLSDAVVTQPKGDDDEYLSKLYDTSAGVVFKDWLKGTSGGAGANAAKSS